MEQSLGRVSEPTAAAADTPVAREAQPAPSNKVRDVPPSGPYDTGITDLDELQRSIDPLDSRKPSGESQDPLDPYGHVI